MNIKQTLFNISTTVLGKLCIMLCSFATMVLTVRFWGAEGRGLIAIYMANLTLSGIFSNVLTNSSACYYSVRVGAQRLWLHALLWTVGVSVISALIMYGWSQPVVTILFLLSSTFLGFITFYLSIFLGQKKVQYYNLFTVLQPVLLIGFMCLIFFCIDESTKAYFYAQMLAYAFCTLGCVLLLRRMGVKLGLIWEPLLMWKNITFGVQEEVGSCLQFVYYRFPYYLLGYISMPSLGVFSIGVSLAESVWVVSKSISLVQYSNLLNPENKEAKQAISDTGTLAFYSLLLSVAIIVIALLLPDAVYKFVFGADFGGVKDIILWLAPGILVMSAARVYANYFSALGKLKIWLLCGAIGAVVGVTASLLLITPYGLKGACASLVLAHFAYSLSMYICFKREGRVV